MPRQIPIVVLLLAGCHGPSASRHDMTSPGDLAPRAATDMALPAGTDLARGGTAQDMPPGAATPIGFSSTRALDGSDAANPSGSANVWVVGLTGAGTTPLTRSTHAGVVGALDPTWSPDGKKVAFESDRALDGSDAQNGTWNVWVMNADGSGATPLTRLTTQYAGGSNPVWSPDGTKIAYHAARALDGSDALNGIASGTQNIWVMNADGSNSAPATRLTAAGAQNRFAQWSPDGSAILFQSPRALDGGDAAGAGANVWVTTPDGVTQRHLTAYGSGTGAQALNGVFSPDSTKVAFQCTGKLDGSDTGNVNLDDNIWVVAASGASSPTPLTHYTAANAGAFTPSWSPSGDRIAFNSSGALDGNDAANGNGTINPWLIGAGGSGAAPLTRLTQAGSDSSGRVAWSGDGSTLVYVSRRALDGSDAANSNGDSNVWRIQADGTAAMALTRLTASGAACTAPSFHP